MRMHLTRKWCVLGLNAFSTYFQLSAKFVVFALLKYFVALISCNYRVLELNKKKIIKQFISHLRASLKLPFPIKLQLLASFISVVKPITRQYRQQKCHAFLMLQMTNSSLVWSNIISAHLHIKPFDYHFHNGNSHRHP